MKIRMMLAGAVCLCAALSASATEWTYSASGTTYTITDGQWTLKVGKLAATNTTLKVTDISTWAEPATDSDKKGVLDLRSPLIVTVNDATATISSVEVAQSALGGDANIVEICCDIIGVMGSSCFAGNENMTNIVIGGTAETLPDLVVNRCSKLKTATFGFPNLRKAGNGSNDNGILGINTTSLTPIDISTVAVPGITNVCKGAFANSLWCGDLVLTNVMAMGANAFKSAALTNVYISGSLKTLPQYALRGTTITNVVFDLPNLESIAVDAFGHPNAGLHQEKIRSVEILSAISDMGQITNIVRYVSGTAASTGCRVYVSKRQWTKKAREAATQAGYFADKATFTDAEKAKIAADPTLAKAYGVLVVGGVRKAFVVNKASPHDKIQGLMIILQ